MSCSVCAGYDSYNCPCCGEDVRMIDCPECKGTGYEPYMAFNIRTRGMTEVTMLTWMLLPRDEEGAERRGTNYCRMPRERCGRCHGEGQVPE